MFKDGAASSLWAVAGQGDCELVDDGSLRDESKGGHFLNSRCKEEGEKKVIFNNVLWGGSVGASAYREYKFRDSFAAKGVSSCLNLIEVQPGGRWPREGNF